MEKEGGRKDKKFRSLEVQRKLIALNKFVTNKYDVNCSLISSASECLFLLNRLWPSTYIAYKVTRVVSSCHISSIINASNAFLSTTWPGLGSCIRVAQRYWLNRIERSHSWSLPLLWPVRQLEADVKHNDVIVTLGLLSKQHVARTHIQVIFLWFR